MSRTGTAIGAPSATKGLTLLRLAAPMVMSRAGLAAMALTDAVMVAHFSSADLAAANLAEGTFGRVVDAFTAFMHAALVLVVAAAAPTRQAERLSIWRRAIGAGLIMGAAGVVLALLAPFFLSVAGQQPDLSAKAGTVILLTSAGLPLALVALASAIHLEAMGRASFVAVVMVIANLLNVAGNWVFIGGNLGAPALGVEGSAAVTAAVRGVLAVALVFAVWRLEGRATISRTGEAGKSTRPDHLRLGLTAFGSSVVMHILGIWLTLFAGWLGPKSLAAFAACWILNMPGLLLAVGVGDAIALRVTRRHAHSGERPLSPVLTDLSVLTGMLLPWALCLAVMPALVAGLYTPDPALRTLMLTLLPLSGLVLVLDGLSYAVAAALRGLKQITVPTIIQVAAMVATAVLAWFLAFGLGQGVTGMLVAILVTSSARLLLLGLVMVKTFRPSATRLDHPERKTA